MGTLVEDTRSMLWQWRMIRLNF